MKKIEYCMQTYHQKPRKICLCGYPITNTIQSDICARCKKMFLMSLGMKLNLVVRLVK